MFLGCPGLGPIRLTVHVALGLVTVCGCAGLVASLIGCTALAGSALALLRLTLFRILLLLTRGLAGGLPLPTLLAPLSLTLRALVLRALDLGAVALRRLLMLRTRGSGLAVSAARHALR
jgi:hypothetical protein